MKPDPRVVPQQERAVNRARELIQAIETARDDGAKATGFEPARVKATRDALADSAMKARVAYERLEQKIHGQVQADDLAGELADDQRDLSHRPQPQTPMERADRLDEERRLATALRNIQAPDAVLEHAEAVRQAENAARVLADEKAGPDKTREAMSLAAQSVPGPGEPAGNGTSRAGCNCPKGGSCIDPEQAIRPEHAAKARELSIRERRLRERLQAVLGDAVVRSRRSTPANRWQSPRSCRSSRTRAAAGPNCASRTGR